MKIKDIFIPHINKVQLEAVFSNDEEQEELVTVLEYFQYHFTTGRPLRSLDFQNGSKSNSYSFWGGKNVAIGEFDEKAKWFSDPVVIRYDDYHPIYQKIIGDI